MKNVMIPEKLFGKIIKYHLLDQEQEADDIRKGLEKKLDAMVNREVYSKSKTAPTEEEREKFRQEYLDRKGMQQGRLGYNSSNDRYGLLSSDLWIDTGFHCGEGLEVLVDDKWVRTRMEMNPAREWYLVGTSYCGDLEYVQARIPE